mmetsp:Transcript_18641/g.39015  ORF Transcript_18641/g.39015 Transcript_18641/m.39015 type:complete len:85 (-) Transcript_18641:122-376(-)
MSWGMRNRRNISFWAYVEILSKLIMMRGMTMPMGFCFVHTVLSTKDPPSSCKEILRENPWNCMQRSARNLLHRVIPASASDIVG